jgi:hypothetical protein
MPTPDEKIREVSPIWRWGGRGAITDSIDMEYVLGAEVQTQITIVRLETAAALYQALAAGSTKAAEILKTAQSGD